MSWHVKCQMSNIKDKSSNIRCHIFCQNSRPCDLWVDLVWSHYILRSVPNGYPNPTRYPVFSSIPDPTRFNFENLRVAGNPKYRVLPEISGNTRSFGYYPKFWVLPDISGCKLFVNYPEYPELPGNTRNTRNYPRVKKIPENTRLYFSTLLPDPNPTRYPVFFPIPDPTRPDIEKPYPLGTD